MSDLEISVVVPVYNSEASLPELVARVEKALAGNRFEILLVNDGSADRSWPVIVELAKEHPGVIGFDLVRNYGQPNALLAGIRAARGARTILLDDDLQHPPEEIPRLLAGLDRGADVVYGVPAKMPHSLYRNAGSWLTKAVLKKAMGTENARQISSFVALRTSIRAAFDHYRSPFVSVDVLFSWGTAKFAAVVVEHHPRPRGKSNYDFWRLASYGLTMVTGFSTVPLRLASVVGFLFTLGGLVTLAYVLAVYFLGVKNVEGFTFLASIVAIFSGAQLFALGIIGEYLGRMHGRLMGSPPYVVGSTTGPDAPPDGESSPAS